MGDARAGAGHFAWVMWGVAALGAHVLLLWSVPGATLETALAAATTISWDTETWEALEPSSPAAAPSEAIAAPLGQPVTPAPRAGTDAPARTFAASVSDRSPGPAAGTDAPARARTARANSIDLQPSAAARPAAAAPKHEDAQTHTDNAHAANVVAREEAQAANVAVREEAHAANVAAREAAHAASAAAHDADAALLARTTEAAGKGERTPFSDSADAQASKHGTGAGVAAASGSGANSQGQGALLRGPRLLATHDPCAGFFPGTAAANRGQVQLSVDVDAQGIPHPTQTLLELPSGQGFENAAKACAAHLHFAPALDAQGHPVSARARIALRFERS